MDMTEYEIVIKNLKALFWAANSVFLENHVILLNRELSERCLCGALMCELNKQLEKGNYNKYYADVEFNRDANDDINCIKKLPNAQGSIKRIFPDIIVHSRAQLELDNLLVFEMKRSSADKPNRYSDKSRLIKMTKLHGNETAYSYGYLLGIYYEIDFHKRQILVEVYQNGEKVEEKTLEY